MTAVDTLASGLGDNAFGLVAAVAPVLGGALLLALIAIAVVVRRGPDGLTTTSLAGSSLFVRWRTWVVILLLWLAAVAHPAATIVFVVAVSFQVVREFARIVGLDRWSRRLVLTVALVSTPLAAFDLTSWRALPPLLLLAATVAPLLREDTDTGLRELAFTTVAMVYLPYLMTYVWLLRAHVDQGPALLLVLGVAVALSDIGAFVAGSAFGRTPLAPRLSPNKTVAGSVGNVLGAAVGVALVWPAASLIAAVVVVLVPLVVGVGAIWGDLLESLVKRSFAVKDAGGCLPGFGGVLDRVDSLLVVAPLTYTMVVVVDEVVSWT